MLKIFNEQKQLVFNFSNLLVGMICTRFKTLIYFRMFRSTWVVLSILWSILRLYSSNNSSSYAAKLCTNV